MSLFNRIQNLHDWENDFPVFASLLFNYVDAEYGEFYEQKYNDVVGSYIQGEYPYYDKFSKLAYQDLMANQQSTFSFIHCDIYLINLKFFEVVEKFIKRKGPVSFAKFQQMIERMSKLQGKNLEDQFNKFISHHKPLVRDVASKAKKSSVYDERYGNSDIGVPKSEEVDKLVMKRNILYWKIEIDIKDIVLRSVKFDTFGRYNASLIKRDAQLLFLRLVRELTTIMMPFLFNWSYINIKSSSENKNCIHSDWDFKNSKRRLIVNLLHDNIREMKRFRDKLKMKAVIRASATNK